MISRMILVGLVAVLGVSLPTRSESGGWLTSAHAWVIGRLAEWDTYTPGEESCSIVTEAPDRSPAKAIQAEARTNTTKSTSFEPIPIGEDLEIGLAFELNRMAEGLGIPATSTEIAESPTDFVTGPSSDSVELNLVVELCRIAEGSAREETVSSPAIPQPRETDADLAVNKIFADISDVFAPPKPDPVAITQQPREASTAAAIEELFADSSNVFAPPEPAPASIAQPRPALIAAGLKIEPIPVPADLESGLAYEMNRASEGLEIVPPEALTVGDARPPLPRSEPATDPEDNRNHDDSSMGKALGLTRDAAFAWMNVLAGMTPVAMSSR